MCGAIEGYPRQQAHRETKARRGGGGAEVKNGVWPESEREGCRCSDYWGTCAHTAARFVSVDGVDGDPVPKHIRFN